MGKTLSSSFTLTAIVDGATYQGIIQSDEPLYQFVNTDTGAVTPDWGQDGSPTFYLEIRDQDGTVIDYDTNTVDIYYGGAKVVANGEPITESVIIRGSIENNTGLELPTWGFSRNIASLDNTDDDYIYMTAMINISGNLIKIQSAQKAISIKPTSGGAAYIMNIKSTDISEQGGIGSVTAVVVDATGSTVTPKSYQWYDLTGSSVTAISGATTKTLTRNPDQIDGYDVFRCVAKVIGADGTEIEVMGVGGIRDFSDPYYAVVELSKEGGVIRKGETIYATPKVYKDDGSELVSEDGKVTVTKSITFVNAENVTVGDIPNENGVYTLSFTKVVECGRKISGYVTAEVVYN